MLKYLAVFSTFLLTVSAAGVGCPKPFAMVNMTPPLEEQIMNTLNGFRTRAAVNRNIGPISNMNILAYFYLLSRIAEKINSECYSKPRLVVRDIDTLEIEDSPEEMDSDNLRTEETTVESPKMKYVFGVSWSEHTSYIYSETTATILIRKWFMEGRYIRKSDLKEITKNANNFTQMMWADTYAVGCSMMTLRDQPIPRYRLLCIFFPKGNVIGEPTFRKGMPCSQCEGGFGCDSKFKQLCGGPYENSKACKVVSSNTQVFLIIMLLHILSF